MKSYSNNRALVVHSVRATPGVNNQEVILLCGTQFILEVDHVLQLIIKEEALNGVP